VSTQAIAQLRQRQVWHIAQEIKNASKHCVCVGNSLATDLVTIEKIPGDVNSDGEVDLSDAIMVTYCSLHEVPSNFNEAVADMNGDGEIDLSDAIIIIYKSLGVK